MAVGPGGLHIKSVVFDWSGVLVDEIAVVATSHVDTIIALGGKPLTREEWCERIGGDWTDVYREQGVPERRIRHASRMFVQRYLELIDLVQPEPGAGELLAALAGMGVKLAVLSNQIRPCVTAVMARQSWSHFFG